MRIKLSIAVFIFIASLFINASPISQPVQVQSTVCRSLYFINAIYIEDSEINETLALETPIDLSFNGINQTVELVVKRNVEFSNVTKSYVFNITVNGSFYGYFVQRINVCYPNPNSSTTLISSAIRDPKTGFNVSEPIPNDILEKYLKEPYGKVVEEVKPIFEEWFRKFHGHRRVSINDASDLGIAVSAALFIYGEYFIKYEEGALPRTMDDVIREKKGDCDDMSRILVELLNSYGIPAVIAYGYAYIPHSSLENLTMTIGNFTYIFRYAGPHAFVLAYIRGYGWLSLDLLASSILYNPSLGRNVDFVFEAFSRETYVNVTEVKLFEDLHRKIRGKQFFTILEEFKDLNDVESLINETLGISKKNITIETSTRVTENKTITQQVSVWMIDVKSLIITIVTLIIIVGAATTLIILLTLGTIKSK